MKNKYISILVSLAMMASVITGCGVKPDSKQGEVSAANVSSEELPSGPVNLRVWGAEEDEELVNRIIDGFKQQYGSQASFNITFEAHSESGCKDEVLGDVLNAPDVFTFADDQLMAMVASGVIKGVENASEISGRNLQAASEAATLGNVLYAYPLTADNGYFLYYNKEYLTEDDVKSMDRILEVAQENGKKVYMEMNSGWYMYSFFGNTGMEIGLNDDGISTYCNWNSKSTDVKGIDVASAMATIGANEAFISSYESGFAGGAADGTIIAGVSGIWDENGIKEAWGDNYGATKLPTYTAAGQQIQMASYAGYKLVGVNSYSENATWAAKFADWMTNEQNQTLRFEMRGQGPSNLNASKAGAVGESKAIQALQKQAEFSSLQRVGGSYWDPSATFGTIMSEGNPSGKDLQGLLNDMVTGITGEEVTGDEAVEEVVEEVPEETVTETAGDGDTKQS
ncbi:MAG: extracellular solute-binding protein [Lachnospiraceae bacterium]|nr:extracellular solute-binding protein [Lachnospiraceae bacterium]